MSAQPAERLLAFPAPDYNQISAFISSDVSDTGRYASVTDCKREVGSRFALKFRNFYTRRLG
jgi:hypothetical protein